MSPPQRRCPSCHKLMKVTDMLIPQRMRWGAKSGFAIEYKRQWHYWCKLLCSHVEDHDQEPSGACAEKEAGNG